MKQYITRLSILLLFLSITLQAAELPLLSDMKSDQQIADSRFLLVFISQPNCSYCRLLEEEILKPMQASGKYDKRLLFRKLIINQNRRLTDTHGQILSANRFALRYDSSLTPTLLFINPNDGTELTDKMIGIGTVEMYGFYVDKAIDAAHAQLRNLNR